MYSCNKHIVAVFLQGVTLKKDEEQETETNTIKDTENVVRTSAQPEEKQVRT